MTKPESAFRRRLTGWLETEFPSAYFHGAPGTAFTSGLLDIEGCFYGTYFAIELKHGDEKPTALQEDTINRIREAGGIALWVNDREDWKTKILVAFCKSGGKKHGKRTR